jgi:hypothetical protein
VLRLLLVALALVLTGGDLVLEHRKRVDLGGTAGGGLLLVEVASERPRAVALLLKQVRLVLVTGGDHRRLVEEHAGLERQTDVLDAPRLILRVGDVAERDRRVVAHERDHLARRREARRMNPALRRAHLHELLAKLHDRCSGKRADIVTRLLVNALDSGGEDAGSEVGGTGEQQEIARVPVDAENGRVVLLDVLGDPPVVLLLKVAHRDDLGARGDGELVLERRPLDVSGGTIDAKNHERWLPVVVLERPHIGVAVLGASYKAIGLRSPIDASDSLIMLIKREDELNVVVELRK